MSIGRKVQQESGIILVMVLMLSLIMSIFMIGIISTSVSGVLSGTRQVDRIKAEAAAKAVDALSYYKHFNNDNSATSLSLPMDNKTFSATVSSGIVDSGPFSTEPYSTSVTY